MGHRAVRLAVQPTSRQRNNLESDQP